MAISISPTTVSITAITIGVAATASFTVTNTGPRRATISWTTDVPFAVVSAPISLNSGASGTLILSYTPTTGQDTVGSLRIDRTEIGPYGELVYSQIASITGTFDISSNISAPWNLFGVKQVALFPIMNFYTHIDTLGFFDTDDFNCAFDMEYDFKIEDINVGKNVTVHRVAIYYRDFGRVDIEGILEITSDDNILCSEKCVSALGGAGDGKIKREFLDLVITGQRPQFKLRRARNAGQLCITKVVLHGNEAEGRQI